MTHASNDSLMEQYASRPWRVAEATDQLRERLAEVFAGIKRDMLA
jgi:hypothetical protein